MESRPSDTTTRRSRWFQLSNSAKAPWSAITAVVVGVALTFIAQLYVFTLLQPFDEQIEQNQLLSVFRDQALLVSSLIPVSAFLVIKKLPFLRSLLIGKISLQHLRMLLKGAGLYFVLTAVGLSLLQLFVPAALEVEQDIGVSSGDPAAVLAVTFMSVVVLAPLVEEILFRGFLFRGFEKTFGFGLAVIASSLLFGLLHGSLAAAVDTFALGAVCCLLVARSGSLWPAILLHALKNAAVFYSRFIDPIV